MTASRRLWGIVGGVSAAASATVAAGAALAGRGRGSGGDPFEGAPLGELRPDRLSTVAADDGTPLAVAEIDPGEGESGLTVVGMHGFALSMRSWYFQRQELATLRLPGVRQVYYDHRAHGRSARATTETSTIEQLAGDLGAVLRSVVPSGPVVLMGHSMGGMVIMELVRQHPDLFDTGRVRGVALIATAAGEIARNGVSRPLLSRHNPLTRGVGGLANWQPGLVEFVRAASGQLTRRAVRLLAFGNRDVSPKLVDFMLEMLSVTSVRGLANFVDTLSTHERYVLLDGLADTEVLIVCGDTDRLTPFHHAEAMARRLPDAELVRVRGAGHMVHLEQAELVNSHLIELIRRCAEPGESETGRRARWWRR